MITDLRHGIYTWRDVRKLGRNANARKWKGQRTEGFSDFGGLEA
jgi:hypothetical protein